MYLKIYDYDLIVAGGGLAGLIAASSAAYYSNQVLTYSRSRSKSYSYSRKKDDNGLDLRRCCWEEICRLHDRKNWYKMGTS